MNVEENGGDLNPLSLLHLPLRREGSECRLTNALEVNVNPLPVRSKPQTSWPMDVCYAHLYSAGSDNQ